MDIKLRKPIIFNVVMLGIVWLVRNNESCKSGPCTPNFDIILPLLFFLVSLFLSIRSLILAISNDNKVYPSLIYAIGFCLLLFFIK
jgi:hypothetical protein